MPSVQASPATDKLVNQPAGKAWTAIKLPILAIAITLLAMVLGMFSLFWQQTTSVIEAGQSLSRTREVASTLDNTLSTLRDADGNAQGYVVTADPQYASLYYHSRAALNSQLVALQRVATSKELQLNRIEDLMRAKVREMDKTVGARTPQNFRDAWLIVVRGPGKKLMDDITALISKDKNEEEEIATRSARNIAASNKNILITLPIVFLIYACLVASLVFMCFKFMREKAMGERQIAQLNNDLHSRVDDLERMTAELEVARDFALEANRLKSQFMANMSHEIRTPMSGVLGMSELLMEDEKLDPDSQELVGYIHSSATN